MTYIAKRPHQPFFVKSDSELLFFVRASTRERTVVILMSSAVSGLFGAIFKQSDGNV